MRRPRLMLVVSLALAIAMAGTAVVYATGADDNTSTVTGNVDPKKLPKTKYKKASLFTQVTTRDSDDTPFVPAEAAEQVFIDFDDDIKINLGRVPVCNETLTGTDTGQAMDLCGPDGDNARIGAGEFDVRLPPTTEITDGVVTAFRGPDSGGRKVIILHAFSPTLTAANTQIVIGRIVGSPAGSDYGKRLSVENAPDVAGDNGALVLFDAKIKRGSVIKARCHDGNRKFNFRSRWNYDDHNPPGVVSTDTDTDTDRCKRS